MMNESKDINNINIVIDSVISDYRNGYNHIEYQECYGVYYMTIQLDNNDIVIFFDNIDGYAIHHISIDDFIEYTDNGGIFNLFNQIIYYNYNEYEEVK